MTPKSDPVIVDLKSIYGETAKLADLPNYVAQVSWHSPARGGMSY
jgi:hypothetical protein